MKSQILLPQVAGGPSPKMAGMSHPAEHDEGLGVGGLLCGRLQRQQRARRRAEGGVGFLPAWFRGLDLCLKERDTTEGPRMGNWP